MRTPLLIALMLCAGEMMAQTVRGKVLNNQRKAVDGAYVVDVKSGKHAHVNHNGQFNLTDMAVGDSVRVSHIGYQTHTVAVDDLDEQMVITMTENILALNEVLISPEFDAINLLVDIDIHTSPVQTSQELLRQVPGLVIGQHAGGGKAEQIFLRGFDVDHGTDVAISVDGMPVNMVSHAHGQGYGDLHFVIPETVDNIHFGKGTYDASEGNFATAGYVGFHTKESLDDSQIKLELGQFNTQRLLAMLDVVDTDKHDVYVASEFNLSDGPFDSPQNFSRFNILGKYTGRLSATDKLSVSISHLTSKWDASGQIPQRAVDSGDITRFGAIDDTEGGNTSRSNIILNYIKSVSEDAFVKNTVYYTHYDFELFSNFTFYLFDPVNGDQIRQYEDRQLYGVTSEYNQSLDFGAHEGLLQVGIGYRNDQSRNNELSHTANRVTTLDTLQLGNIDESNLYGYVNLEMDIGRWVINPGLRVDHFKFNYYDQLLTTYDTQAEQKGILSPKLNILFNPSTNLQLYLKTGKGFHSNDTRVVVAQNGREILPSAYGGDLGYMWKPVSNIVLNMAYWALYLEQEFVYVGDAGIVEPSGETMRTGLDFSLRYQPLQWLYWNVDVNYALARALGEPRGEDYIPLAPDLTLTSSVSVVHPSGVYGSVNFRYVKDRPANEDNSIVAEGYQVVDLNAGYQWGSLDFGINIQNVFNTEWNETQFATESQLLNETAPVEEINFTPGTPFFAKASVAYRF
ncbi:TonB-dependent receptor [Reichenbachiella sp. 5M10]|nr:TonB-dependent receptor [Reichenbachiella sp. 5M10]